MRPVLSKIEVHGRVCMMGLQVQQPAESRFSEDDAARSGPENPCSDPVESGWAGRIRHSSMKVIPSILQSEKMQTGNVVATDRSLAAALSEFAKHKRSDWVLCPHEGVRKWGGGGSCLLCGCRTTVLLIGVEGFPHSGFRHFIRYVNIRGVRPEEPAEEEEESRGVKWCSSGREVSRTRNQTSKKERKVKFTQIPTPLIMLVWVCVYVWAGVLTWGRVSFGREWACCSPWESQRYFPSFRWA